MIIPLDVPLLCHYIQVLSMLWILHMQIQMIRTRSLPREVASSEFRVSLYSWETWTFFYFTIWCHLDWIAFLLSKVYYNNETVHPIYTSSSFIHFIPPQRLLWLTKCRLLKAGRPWEFSIQSSSWNQNWLKILYKVIRRFEFESFEEGEIKKTAKESEDVKLLM